MIDLGKAKGLLHKLLKQGPNSNRTPRENFFTEVFAGYLSLYPAALRTILDHAELAVDVSEDTSAELEVKTQRNWGPWGRPDVVVFHNGVPILAIECKMGAGFTESDQVPSGDGEDNSEDVGSIHQIPKYCAKLRDENWPARVLVISERPRDAEVRAALKDSTVDFSDYYAGNLLWSGVYKALSSLRSDQPSVESVVLELLLDLMEDMGMKEPTPLNSDVALAYEAYMNARSTMQALLDRVSEICCREFKCEPSSRRMAADFVYKYMDFGQGNLLGMYLEFEDPEKEVSVWPMLHVDSRHSQAEAVEEYLKCVEHESRWNGKVCYPPVEAVVEMLEAGDWDDQISKAWKIFSAWLNTLADEGLIERR